MSYHNREKVKNVLNEGFTKELRQNIILAALVRRLLITSQALFFSVNMNALREQY